MPEGLDFTFAIAELGVSQEVSGDTAVSFVASTAGEFEYSCSSCEDWRGMTGTLVVE
jgi:plastocyanin